MQRMMLYIEIFLLLMTMMTSVLATSIRPADEAWPSNTDTCHCYMDHPQRQYCTVGFVGLVSIVGKQKTNGNVTYNTLILDVFKDIYTVLSEERQAFSEVDINAPVFCDPQLKENKTYLISASFGHFGLEGLTTSECLWNQNLDYNLKVADITADVRNKVSLYEKNCDKCEIAGIYQSMDTISKRGGPPGQNGPPGSHQNGRPDSEQAGPPAHTNCPPAPISSQSKDADHLSTSTSDVLRKICFFNGNQCHQKQACTWDPLLGCRWTEIYSEAHFNSYSVD